MWCVARCSKSDLLSHDACELLLALELLVIALCTGSDGSELGVIDIINGVSIAKLCSAV